MTFPYRYNRGKDIIYRKAVYTFNHQLLFGRRLYYERISCPDLSGLSHSYMDYKTERGKLNFPDFSELQKAIETLDNAFVEMVASLSDEDLSRTVTFTTTRGTAEYALCIFIMQYANHGTHHRGQISQILDEMGVENNFSGIAPKYD